VMQRPSVAASNDELPRIDIARGVRCQMGVTIASTTPVINRS
jgi:hypothetical protein